MSEELSKFTRSFKTMTEEKTNVHKRSDNGNGDREKEVCCTEFLGGKGSCNYKDRCRFSHNIDFKKREVCRFDLKKPGSCRYERKCSWSHQTPTNLRNDKKFVNQFLNTQYESLPNIDEQFVLQRQFQDTEEHPINHRRTYQSREEVPYHPRGNFQNNPPREIAECPDSITTNQMKQHQHFLSQILGEWKKCK